MAEAGQTELDVEVENVAGNINKLLNEADEYSNIALRALQVYVDVERPPEDVEGISFVFENAENKLKDAKNLYDSLNEAVAATDKYGELMSQLKNNIQKTNDLYEKVSTFTPPFIKENIKDIADVVNAALGAKRRAIDMFQQRDDEGAISEINKAIEKINLAVEGYDTLAGGAFDEETSQSLIHLDECITLASEEIAKAREEIEAAIAAAAEAEAAAEAAAEAEAAAAEAAEAAEAEAILAEAEAEAEAEVAAPGVAPGGDDGSDVDDPSGAGKATTDPIDWEDIKWGSFSAQYKHFKSLHPSSKLATLKQFAKYILAPQNKDKTIERTKRRARFYLNVIKGGNRIPLILRLLHQ